MADDEQRTFYYIKFYIGITISKGFALSTGVLFILLIQLVSKAQFCNITYLSVLYPCLTSAFYPASTTVMVPLTGIYALL